MRPTEASAEADDAPAVGIAWLLTDQLVSHAQQQFRKFWDDSKGETGWVSFELDPLLVDIEVAGYLKANRTR